MQAARAAGVGVGQLERSAAGMATSPENEKEARRAASLGASRSVDVGRRNTSSLGMAQHRLRCPEFLSPAEVSPVR